MCVYSTPLTSHRSSQLLGILFLLVFYTRTLSVPMNHTVSGRFFSVWSKYRALHDNLDIVVDAAPSA